MALGEFGMIRVRVSEQLLLQALYFPRGSVIRHVESFYGNGYCDVDMVISHPDLTEKGEPVLATPRFESHDGATLMVDWGLHGR